MDVSDLSAKTVESSGDAAKTRAAIGLAVQPMNVNRAWQMTRGGGEWKRCGNVIDRAATAAAQVVPVCRTRALTLSAGEI